MLVEQEKRVPWERQADRRHFLLLCVLSEEKPDMSPFFVFFPPFYYVDAQNKSMWHSQQESIWGVQSIVPATEKKVVCLTNQTKPNHQQQNLFHEKSTEKGKLIQSNFPHSVCMHVSFFLL